MNNFTEKQVIEIWQRQLRDGTELTSEDGEPIQVIYPGRRNDDRGADFRDAVIATRGRLITGDVEFHVKSSDWQAHRHHHDLAYNRVILHVVMWHDPEKRVDLQNGRSVPTLALHKYLRSPISRRCHREGDRLSSGMPCLQVAERLTPGIVAEFLDNAGEQRFLAKATQFQTDLAKIEASQSLYQGIMTALGYTKNKLPFLEVARRLPLQTLESMTRIEIPDEECLARQQALLLGTAGLLPSQYQNRHQGNKSDDQWIDKLEGFWAASCHLNAMSRDDWNLCKVRPNNSPVRRLVAMSYLVLRYKRERILPGIINVIKGTPVSKGNHGLERGLVVTTDGYWANHLDFGLSSKVESSTLIGGERAADIAVNVLLPSALAWSKLTSQPELERKALDLYHAYPRLTTNVVERHMKAQLGLGSCLIKSAQRQQGLLHIYHTLCTQGRCRSCRLGHLETGGYIQI